jgi:hypothetical protein
LSRCRCRAALAASTAILVTLADVRVATLQGSATDLRVVGPTLRATLELNEAFEPRYRRVLNEGGTLHVRIEAELWERRAGWDRAADRPVVSSFRILRERTGEIGVSDAFGGYATHPAPPDPLVLHVDLAAADRIEARRRYYLHATVTIGLIGDRDIDETGEAVFGRGEAGGLSAVGRLLFRTVMQLTDYVQSTNTRIRSRVYTGRELLEAGGQAPGPGPG